MYAGKVIENNVEVTFNELLDVHHKTYLEDGLHLNGAGYQKTYKYSIGFGTGKGLMTNWIGGG